MSINKLKLKYTDIEGKEQIIRIVQEPVVQERVK